MLSLKSILIAASEKVGPNAIGEGRFAENANAPIAERSTEEHEAHLVSKRVSSRCRVFLGVCVVGVMVAGCRSGDALLSPPATIPTASTSTSGSPSVFSSWQSCTSWDGGATYSCILEGFTSYDFYYYSFPLVSQVSTKDCSVEVCSFGGPGYRSVPSSPEGDVLDIDGTSIDCSKPQTFKGNQLYCGGFVPSGSRLTRITAALNRMRVINSDCAHLAAIADTLLSGNKLHLFVGDSTAKGGYAMEGGGATGPNAWMAIDVTWTDAFWDNAHYTVGEPVHRNLQQSLAHELDHLAGALPVHTTSPYSTPHSESCSLVP